MLVLFAFRHSFYICILTHKIRYKNIILLFQHLPLTLLLLVWCRCLNQLSNSMATVDCTEASFQVTLKCYLPLLSPILCMNTCGKHQACLPSNNTLQQLSHEVSVVTRVERVEELRMMLDQNQEEVFNVGTFCLNYHQ